MLVSLIIVGLFFVGWKFGGDISAALYVSPIAAALSGLTAVIAIFAYLWAPHHKLKLFAFISFTLLAITSGYMVVTTGATTSPFLALWMLIVVFSGVFGLLGIGSIFVSIHAYLLYRLFIAPEGMTKEQLVLFVLACELPLAVSYLIWHTKNSHQNDKDKAFDALARELNQVANKSEIVINAIADGVLAIDARGTIQLINPAAQTILGWTKQDAIGLDYHSVLKLITQTAKEITPETDPIQQVIHSGQSLVNNDLSLMTQAGKQVLLSLLISPISNTPGSGVITVFRDITADKAEERQQAEFISTASHEMRTPVAAMEGYLGLALNPATATIDDKARMYLIKAHEAALHMGRLFQDLLDVSKAEDGRLTNNPSVTDVVAFVRDIVTGLTPKAKEKNLFLYFKPGEPNTDNSRHITPVFYTKVDNDHLNEILANLIENGIKYTKEGSVTVDVVGDNEWVSIIIKDTGIGIPREDLPHLFQKFYRVDSTETREIGGTGLGLYLCRRLAEAMSGKIALQSEYGKGSIFTLKLPRMSNEDAMAALDEVSEEVQRPAIRLEATPVPLTPAPSIPPSTPMPTPITLAAPVAATPQPAPVQPVVPVPIPAPTVDPMIHVVTPTPQVQRSITVPQRPQLPTAGEL